VHKTLACRGPVDCQALAAAAELLPLKGAAPAGWRAGRKHGDARADALARAGDAACCPLRLAFFDEACERRLACAMLLHARLGSGAPRAGAAAAPLSGAAAATLQALTEYGVFRHIVDLATEDTFPPWPGPPAGTGQPPAGGI